MLHSINELREHQPPSPGGGTNVAMSTTPIYHTLALLHTVLGEHDKVILCMLPDEMLSHRFGVFLCVCGDGGEGGGERGEGSPSIDAM